MPSPTKGKKATVGKPGKKRVATASEWKKASAAAGLAGAPEDVEVPSGTTIRCLRPGLREFMAMGLIPDSLTPEVEKAISGNRNVKLPTAEEIMKDPQKLADIELTTDRIVVFVVQEPKVLMRPDMICDHCLEEHRDEVGDPKDHRFKKHRRKASNLYVDEVDQTDKLFITNFAVGGTRDLARFHEELSGGMGGVRPRKNVPRAAKRPVRNPGKRR